MNEITIDKLLDTSTKYVFSYKLFLAEIMKDCIHYYHDESCETIAKEYIQEIHVQNKYVHYMPSVLGGNTEDNTDSKRVTFDLLFYARLPKKYGYKLIKINLELQSKFNPGYDLLNRMIFYESRNISNQYQTHFEKLDYNRIIPLYTIFICMNPPMKKQDGINCYVKNEVQLHGHIHEKRQTYTKHKGFMIYLSRKDSQIRCIQMCGIILNNQLSVQEKIKRLKNELNIDLDELTEKEMTNMCDYSAYIRNLGKQEGISQGIKQGIEQGIEQGKLNGIIDSLRSIMKRLNLTLDDAIIAMDVPENLRERCRQALTN